MNEKEIYMYRQLTNDKMEARIGIIVTTDIIVALAILKFREEFEFHSNVQIGDVKLTQPF